MQFPIQSCDSLSNRTQRVVMLGEFSPSVVADADEQIEAVAVPLDTHAARLPMINKCQDCTSHNCPSSVCHFSRKSTSRRGWLNELNIQIAVPYKRPQVCSQPGKGTDHWLKHRFTLLIGRRPPVN
jgi:hypothetical protein